jgi:hypothetical protein
MKKRSVRTKTVEKQNNRHKLSLSEAEAMLPEGDDIHTFRGGGAMLIGADWRRKQILCAIEKHGAELSGPTATAMRHGLVLFDDRGALFIATREASSVPEFNEKV